MAVQIACVVAQIAALAMELGAIRNDRPSEVLAWLACLLLAYAIGASA